MLLCNEYYLDPALLSNYTEGKVIVWKITISKTAGYLNELLIRH